MFLLAIIETAVGLSLSMYRWNALPEQNINISKYFNNTLLSLNPKRIKKYALCPKRPEFSKFSNIISMLICLKGELQVKEKGLFDCFWRKQ